MKIQVRLFAGVAQRAGTRALTLELPTAATVADAHRQLAKTLPGLDRIKWAVNQEYAAPSTVLHDADILAAIPEVSGG